MVPLAAEALLFFACAKKSRQKKAHPGGPSAAARRVRSPGGNFRAGHPALYENGAHPCAPPLWGFTRRDCRTSGGPIAKAEASARAAVLLPLLFGVPMRHGEWAGPNPKGAAPDGRRFRMAHGCALRKFPDCSRTRSAQRGGRAAWGVFLWFLSLHEQSGAFKQPNGWSRNAPAASGTMCPTRRSRPQGRGTKSHRGSGAHHGELRHGLRWPSPQPLSRRERGSRRSAQGVTHGACFFGFSLCTSKEVLLDSRMAGQGPPLQQGAPFCPTEETIRKAL